MAPAPSATFVVRPARHGRGLFAARALRAGETILVVPRGRLITYGQLLRKRNTDDPLQVSARRYLDWRPPGVLMNHSCRPNCGLTSFPRVTVIALRDARAGDELTWDYSTSIDQDTECDFRCACRSRGCRRAIGGFRWLPVRQRLQYSAAGVVQRYLLDPAR